MKYAAVTKASAKLKVRHTLFKKIIFSIFLNNRLTAYMWQSYRLTSYCLLTKKQKPFFCYQSMPNLQFCRTHKNKELVK